MGSLENPACQSCPHCAALIDISDSEPLDAIVCPACQGKMSVSGQIGAYQVLEVAGKGGMGIVYRAYDPSLDRDVALKLLRKKHSQDAILIRQLESEAAITASITDPNVVRVFCTGADRGRFFLAMELVNKGSLDDLLHLQGKIAEVHALEIGIQIASGLRAAWRHGLIHRDVKPGNILFADAHTAKIVDFGLAIFMSEEESARGEVWGTPYYVAPEKLDQEPEDFRSDMYSLGATLFHALAGRPPFEAENASMVAMKHLKSQAVSLQAFAPGISNSTAHIINRTLAKNPANRFQSYDELIGNFEYALDQLKKGRQARQSQRLVLETDDDHRMWTWVVMVMAVVIVGILGWFVMNQKKGANTAVTANTSSTTTPSATKDFRTLEPALKALAGGEDGAAAVFAREQADEKFSAADRSWLALLEGTAHLASGKSAEAQTAFAKVETLAQSITDLNKKKFIVETAARLSRREPIMPADIKADDYTSGFRPFALFAYGLHDWSLGKLDEGTELLRHFRSSNPDSLHPWFNALKPLVSSVVEDLVTIRALEGRLKNSPVPAELADIASKLRGLHPVSARYGKEMIAPYAQQVEAYVTRASLPPTDGVYRLINKNNGAVADVSNCNRDNGAGISLFSSNRGPNQSWVITPASDGSYFIRAIQGGALLDVQNENRDEGGRVQMWERNESGAQRWLFEPAGDGYFKIRSKASKLLLTAGSDQLEQRSDSGDAPQLWLLQREGDPVGGDWYRLDLAEFGKAVTASYGGGRFTLSHRGKDMWGTKDECAYLGRGAGANFDLIARVIAVQGTAQPKVGLMIRNGLAADNTNAALVYAAGRVFGHQRSSIGGETTFFPTMDSGANLAMSPSPAGLPLLLADPDFETINVGEHDSGGYRYNPEANGWTYSTKGTDKGAGLTGNKSGFTGGNPDAPKGRQAGFLQSTCWISQTVNSTEAGVWTLTLEAAQRGWGQQMKPQRVRVSIDGTEMATFSPSGTNYTTQTLRSRASIPAGSHVLKLEGLNPDDETVFIDDLKLAVATSTPVKPIAFGAGLPTWLKLERRGDQVSAYRSNDGQIWVPIGRSTIHLNPTVFVGFAVSSRDEGKPVTAAFDSVTFADR